MDPQIASTTQVPLPPYPPAPATAVLASRPKSPALALVLSFVPGIGQIYNGQPAKAFVFFFSFVACIWMCVDDNPMPFALIIPFVYFYGLVDAYASAALINARHAGGTLPAEEATESPAWGWTLVVVGGLLLLNNLGWLPLVAVRRFWPLVLIGAGVFFAYGAMQRRSPAPSAEADRDAAV